MKGLMKAAFEVSVGVTLGKMAVNLVSGIFVKIGDKILVKKAGEGSEIAQEYCDKYGIEYGDSKKSKDFNTDDNIEVIFTDREKAEELINKASWYIKHYGFYSINDLKICLGYSEDEIKKKDEYIGWDDDECLSLLKDRQMNYIVHFVKAKDITDLVMKETEDKEKADDKEE